MTALLLMISLIGCSATDAVVRVETVEIPVPVPQAIPEQLTRPCIATRPAVATWGNIVSALKHALDECNRDKAALREIKGQ